MHASVHACMHSPVGVDSMIPSAWTLVMNLPFSQHSMFVRKAFGPRSITSSFRTS